MRAPPPLLLQCSEGTRREGSPDVRKPKVSEWGNMMACGRGNDMCIQPLGRFDTSQQHLLPLYALCFQP